MWLHLSKLFFCQRRQFREHIRRFLQSQRETVIWSNCSQESNIIINRSNNKKLPCIRILKFTVFLITKASHFRAAWQFHRKTRYISWPRSGYPSVWWTDHEHWYAGGACITRRSGWVSWYARLGRVTASAARHQNAEGWNFCGPVRRRHRVRNDYTLWIVDLSVQLIDNERLHNDKS